MNAPNDGAAREVAPGRLANFEDSDDDGQSTITLPPRSRTTRHRTTTGIKQAIQGLSRPAAAPEAPTTTDEPSAAAQGPLKGPEDRVRASNVHIPVALLAPLTAKCKADGMSHGEVVIVAIENAHPRLAQLIHPAATAGGSLFASRRARPSRATEGPLTPLNYRLREGDFATLDALVREFEASSRGQLITCALTDYFDSPSG